MFDVLYTHVLPFLVVLTILVYVHEYGHYWVAVKNGVKVEVFSIGFGPELFGWYNKAGVRWKVCAIPMGGYVKMFGQSDTGEDGKGQDSLTEEEIAGSFSHKRLSQRAAIVLAGPMANFIFAIVVFFGLAWLVGTAIPNAGIGSVQSGSPAEKAGIEVGDTILSIDNQEITLFTELQDIVRSNPDTPLMFLMKRNDQQIPLSVTPRSVEQENGEIYGQLGVSPDAEQIFYERESFLDAAQFGVERTYGMVTGILVYLGEVFTGARGTEELGGPLRIAELSGDMAAGGIINLIFFMAALSVNLGLINLFPIPMLDGGHLVFYVAEFVLGRPVGSKAQEYSFGIGLMLLVFVFVFVTWKDLEHFGLIEFLKGLIS